MTITEAQKKTGLLRQTIRYRMTKLGIYEQNITDYNLEQIINFVPQPKSNRYRNANQEALVWEYYIKSKNNEIPTIAKQLCMSVGSVGYIISKIQKRGYIILQSKLNAI